MRPFTRRTTVPRPRLLAALAALLLVAGCSLLARPQLSVSPSTLAFDADTTRRTLTISNVGTSGSTLSFELSSPSTRLSFSPVTGSVTGGASRSVTVDADVSDLAGSIFSLIHVATNAGSFDVGVTLSPQGGDQLCFLGTSGAAGSALDVASVPAGLAPGAPIPGQVLVTYHGDGWRAGLTPLTATARGALADDVASAVGATVARLGAGSVPDLMIVAAGAEDAAIDRLRADPRVRAAAPNVAVARAYVPDDPYYTVQWNLSLFGLEEAWELQSGSGTDVVIAVIDDGVNVDHVDLVGRTLPGYDFFCEDADVQSVSSHGSHVAGIAAAHGDNEEAIAGVAFGPDVYVRPAKVFPDEPDVNGSVQHILTAMAWATGLLADPALPAVTTPADVINLSLGFGKSIAPSLQQMFEDLLDDLEQAGTLVVAAAGNFGHTASGGTGVEYPARLDRVLAVGSVDSSYSRSSFSDYGEGLDLMAPGGTGPANPTCSLVLSLGASGDDLVCMAGTSMATPFVAGTAALLIASDPATFRYEPETIRDHLVNAAWLPVPGTAPDPEYGHGIVCPDAVLGAPTTCGAVLE
jgi:subtilisin family serine protease